MSRDKEQNLKIVTAGIKVLERMANKGKGAKEDDYRLVQVWLLFFFAIHANSHCAQLQHLFSSGEDLELLEHSL